MRLLTKTTLYFLLAMVPLLVAAGYLLFRLYSTQINEQADKELVYEEAQWLQYLETATADGTNFILRSPDLLIYPTQDPPTAYPELSNTSGTKARASVQIPYRQLAHVVNVNGITYQIVIRKSQEQKLALVTNITSILLLVFAGLFGATLLFNWVINKRIWRPFQASLQKVRHLELQKIEGIRFEETNIKEFNELNATLNTMVQKIQSDYLNMKEFTENIAHEMQTPLAVALSKLELLLQDRNLNDAQLGTIAQATEALSRLSKLNQSLLLLAKIENHQFEGTETISLAATTQKYLRLFDEMIKDKKLSVEMHVESDFTAMLHLFLADSLVSNLLGNAIKYNFNGGKINIRINNKEYCLSNTSNLLAIDAQDLFQRFHASQIGTDPSTGLGLAIAKRIADTSHLSISYQYDDGFHRFCIRHV
ncbi:PorY family sensor histidine kinase [Flavisolibacter nicotianae]|uniref:PorY family sensor histidine kinase n=1 Tax=Flavisolibacter nicotianae TaxID=2364882 RepID=UPI000EAB994B|nr:histidine kinase dimerization/phospho-acceptor domain-containing protein [Flavisolibacter nicotianae]